MPQLVTEPGEVEALATRLAGAPLVAFDLEFVSQDRLTPTLCLVQIAWIDDAGPGQAHELPVEPARLASPEVRLIDPTAADAAPVIAALAAHPLVIAHAPRQDLALLATRFGTSMPGIVDTQLMAAFCGLGEQVGLAALGNELLGLSLAKDLQWTDWARRPLSEAQLVYADADVRYLPRLYATLADRLGPRLSWVREESRAILAEAIAAAEITPETAWRNVGGTRGLDGPARAAVIALAAWRLRVAVELDRPVGQVLADKALVELARHRPGSPGGVRAVRGLSPISSSRADQLARAIAGAGEAPVGETRAWKAASARAQRWAEMLLAIVQVVSDQSSIAARLLATRADAEELARVVDEAGLDAAASLPAFSSWRREVLGAAWRGWLEGALSLVGDASAPHGIRLVPR